jgi:hypothetical protein
MKKIILSSVFVIALLVTFSSESNAQIRRKFDRREDVRDRREDVRDRREDVRDRRVNRGPLDRIEDIHDRREDVRDRREDKRDRRRGSF